MISQSEALERAKGMMEDGMSLADANVEMVRMQGVVVVYRLPREIRKALMAGVKDGRLGRLKKDGVKSEVFFHPGAIYRAKEMRSQEENATRRAVSTVMYGRPALP